MSDTPMTRGDLQDLLKIDVDAPAEVQHDPYGGADAIQAMLILRDVRTAELARALCTSKSNLYNKLRRNNFTIRELHEIADTLGFEMKVTLTDMVDADRARVVTIPPRQKKGGTPWV